MNTLKKYAFYGSTVAASLALALVMLVSSTPRIVLGAASVTTQGIATANLSTNETNGTNAVTALTTNIVFTSIQAIDYPTGTIVLAAPTGWEFAGDATVPDVAVAGAALAANAATTFTTSSGAACVALTGCAKMVITITAASSAVGTITVGGTTKPRVRPISNTTGTGNIVVDAQSTSGAVAVGSIAGVLTVGAYGALTAPYSIAVVLTTSSTTCGTTNPVSAASSTVLADGSQTLRACATVTDVNGAPVNGVPINMTVSAGVLGTGTGKTAQSPTNTAGNTSNDYRGGGNVAGTDTVIASSTTLNAVGTLAITLTAAGGTTAAKVVVGPAQQTALGAVVSNASPGYVAPQFGTTTYVQVVDASGLGVNGQVVLLSTDRGSLVDGIASSCVGVTAKSITPTTASEAQVTGGTATPGSIAFTICTNQLDAPGKATITAQNISTTMANGTLSVSMGGRPSKIDATAAGNAVTVKVTDAGGNAVADGTPVRFTMSANAGAVSTTCTTTTNGAASSVVALIAATGTVLVSTDWSETGAVPACGTAANAGITNYFSSVTGFTGAQTLAASVNVPGGTGSAGGTTPVTPPVTPPAAGTGTFAATPVFSASKLANAVFTGSVEPQLLAALNTAGATGAWAQDSKGVFHLYVVNGGFVNDGFKAAFPTGFTVPSALTLVGK